MIEKYVAYARERFAVVASQGPKAAFQKLRIDNEDGNINLVLGFNTGVSFGLFGQAPAWLLMAFTLAIVAGLLVWIHRSDSRLTASALGLVVGGALGNLLDRLRQGAVADFLDFYIGSYHWPAFNLADVAIVCGVGLLLVESVLARGKTKAA